MSQKIFSYFNYGILLHLSALPSKLGIGDLGEASFSFLNWLQSIGAKTWQILPTGVPDKTFCPYACYSAFGGNPLFISLESLKKEGLIKSEIIPPKSDGQANVHFSKVQHYKRKYLSEAFSYFEKFFPLKNSEYTQFLEKEQFWLQDLSIFLVLTEEYGHNWSKWPNHFKDYASPEIKIFKQENKEAIDYQIFLQFVFHQQWKTLKEKAESKGISIFGDIPIFVSFHSMEVWKNPNQFKLNKDRQMEIETGVPPDIFNRNGQKWGTPNYNWGLMKEKHFSWWIERIKYQERLFHLLRLDHFLGFINVWESPKEDLHSKNGKWVKTPGDQLLKKIREKFPSLPLVAEDLGEINNDVLNLKKKYKLPGMKILQFALGENPDRQHRPDSFTGHEIVYSGTHDNNTLNGYFEGLSPEQKISFTEDIKSFSNEKNINWAIIDTALNSKASMAIFPIQDLLGLGSEARFNEPGTISSTNWSWRLLELPKKNINNKIKSMAKEAGRL